MNKLKERKMVLKPWGAETWFAQVPGKYMGKILLIEKGQSTSLHYHKKKEETLIVVSGRLDYTCVDKEGKRQHCRLGFYETVHIPPGTQHSLAAGHHAVTLFEVSSCHPEDSFRVEDYYKRPCSG